MLDQKTLQKKKKPEDEAAVIYKLTRSATHVACAGGAEADGTK